MVINALWPWPFTFYPKITRAHPWLIRSLYVKFHDDRCKEKAVKHTCEPSDGRMNSPVFWGHLPISNILPNSPDFYMFLPYSPDFYLFTSQMCNLHHVHLGQGSKMQFEWHTCGILILYTMQKSFILTSKFVLTTLYTHPGLIISHLFDDYLNIC